MADVQKNTNSVVAWLTMLIAVVALLIAISAYNRSGEDLDETVREQATIAADRTEEAADNISQEIDEARDEVMETAAQVQARAELESRLVAIRAQVAANNVTDATADEVADIRADLRTAYSNASGNVQDWSSEMDQDLERLETEVREDTAAALTTIDNLIERMRADVLTDEDDSN